MIAKTGIVICLMFFSQYCLALDAPINLDTLTSKADRIVRGKVVGLSYSHETSPYGDDLIYTNVTIRVAESLKGDRSDLQLKVEGGTLNGIRLTVSDAPSFRAGEEVLVFAKKGYVEYRPYSGSSSKYTISKGGRIVENGTQYTQFRTTILKSVQQTSVHQ